MNYIKGFRYQIYCAAREAGVTTCTVAFCAFTYSNTPGLSCLIISPFLFQIFVVATPDQCRERNAKREAEDAYRPETYVTSLTTGGLSLRNSSSHKYTTTTVYATNITDLRIFCFVSKNHLRWCDGIPLFSLCLGTSSYLVKISFKLPSAGNRGVQIKASYK